MLTDSLQELYAMYQSIRTLPFIDRSNWLGDGNSGLPFLKLLRSVLGQIGNNEAARMLSMLGDLRSNEQRWDGFDESFAALVAALANADDTLANADDTLVAAQ